MPGELEHVTALLEMHDVHAAYGPLQVLRGMDLRVDEGEVVVLLGANGAGKTTTVRAICQMVGTKGDIQFDGVQLVGKRPDKMAALGIAHVPQGRGTFPELTVEENLEVGAYARKDRSGIRADTDRWFQMFPRLAERRGQLAGSLSGGEQQMLAVSRALMSRPRLLLLDEPSLGLAPIVIQDLFARFGQLNDAEGVTMFVVEQNANIALAIADRAYVLEAGSIVLSGSADELRANDSVRRAYLGF
jgi:branched-chain amino acid transport system ATP-binding protein